MKNPTAAFIIIGNEILDGSTKEGNLQTLVELLKPKGIPLIAAEIVRDDNTHIQDALRRTTSKYDYVFTSGGIGPTHDDITCQAVADFFSAKVELNEEALQLLAIAYESRGPNYINDAVKKMAYIPEGAELIYNSVSAAPGFRLNNVFVMAGVPSIFKAMVEDVLPKLPDAEALLSESLIVYAGESRIAKIIKAVEDDHDDLELGSYPRRSDEGQYFVKIVLRSHSADTINTALDSLKKAFKEKDYNFSE